MRELAEVKEEKWTSKEKWSGVEKKTHFGTGGKREAFNIQTSPTQRLGLAFGFSQFTT